MAHYPERKLKNNGNTGKFFAHLMMKFVHVLVAYVEPERFQNIFHFCDLLHIAISAINFNNYCGDF